MKKYILNKLNFATRCSSLVYRYRVMYTLLLGAFRKIKLVEYMFVVCFLIFASCQSSPDKDDGLAWQDTPSADPFYKVQSAILDSCSQTQSIAGFLGLMRLQPAQDALPQGVNPTFLDSPVAGAWGESYKSLRLYVLGPFGEDLAHIDVVPGKPTQLTSPYPLPASLQDQTKSMRDALDALGPLGTRSLVCGRYALEGAKSVESPVLEAGRYRFENTFAVGERRVNVHTQAEIKVEDVMGDDDLELVFYMESVLHYGIFGTVVGRVTWQGTLSSDGDETPILEVQRLTAMLDDHTMFLWVMEYE